MVRPRRSDNSIALVDSLIERVDLHSVPDACAGERVVPVEVLDGSPAVCLDEEHTADHRLFVVGEQRPGDQKPDRSGRQVRLMVLVVGEPRGESASA